MFHDSSHPVEPPSELTPLVEEITRLYWDEKVKVDAIVKRYGFKTRRQVLEYVVPMGFEKTCRECGVSFVVMFRNRTEAEWKYSHASWQYQVGWTCDECMATTEERKARRVAESEMRARKRAEFVHALKTMPYREYLQTEHWQATRQQALQSAGYRCQMCNAKGRLHVHHRTYERRGEERMTDLLVLCEKCHREFHDRIGMPV